MDEKDRTIVTFGSDEEDSQEELHKAPQEERQHEAEVIKSQAGSGTISGEGFVMKAPEAPVMQPEAAGKAEAARAADTATHIEAPHDMPQAGAAGAGAHAGSQDAMPHIDVSVAESPASYGSTGGTSGEVFTAEPVSPGTRSNSRGSRNSSRKNEKKYVTKSMLVTFMIITMIVSSILGAVCGAAFSKLNSGGSAARNDSELSELNLSDATGSELTVAEIIKKNENAVVEIVVEGTTQGMWGQLQLTQGAGSGVIVREDGYIATNYHVIDGANKVQVTLHNGESYSATIVGSDSENDIAVIKIDEKGLTTAEIGDSSKVSVGDLAVAIGNPLGQLGGTATSGIVSALDRTLNIEGTTLTLMQTDAAINGGNSGGGLFNGRGELIGIVESKAEAVGVEGLAFAIPINSVSEIINDIIKNGGSANTSKATPAIGVVISDVSESNAQYYGLESAGVYIAQVTGSNAQKAGFQEKDRVISINGKEISSSSEFISVVRKCKVGDTVTVVVSRNGQQIEIKTVLEELQQTQE